MNRYPSLSSKKANSYASNCGPKFRTRSSDHDQLYLRVRGWRICGWGVSGKRTLPQGESKLIKPNPGEIGLRIGLRARLGQQVGERLAPAFFDSGSMIFGALPWIGWRRREATAQRRGAQVNPSESNLIKAKRSRSVDCQFNARLLPPGQGRGGGARAITSAVRLARKDKCMNLSGYVSEAELRGQLRAQGPMPDWRGAWARGRCGMRSAESGAFGKRRGFAFVTEVGEFPGSSCPESGHFLKVNQGQSNQIKADKARERVLGRSWAMRLENRSISDFGFESLASLRSLPQISDVPDSRFGAGVSLCPRASPSECR